MNSSTHITPTPSSPARQNVPSSTPPRKPLSCVNCRRRKVKCDRTFPCRQCVDYTLECVVPGRRSPWLMRRARLESEQGSSSSSSHRGDKGRISVGMTGPAPPPVQSLGLGGSFWETICTEVDGLKDSLSKAEATPERAIMQSVGFLDAHLLGLGRGPPSISPTRGAAVQRIATSQAMMTRLIPVFFANVDPVFKILHRPIILSRISTSGLELPVFDKSYHALMSAVCFAAVSSLSPEASLEMFGEPKGRMADGWRVETEAVLAETSLLTAPDLTTLQALTLYTMAVRQHDLSFKTCSLVATTIRLAQVVGLHREELLAPHSVFDQEMMRRLWAQLLVLDLRCAEDRGVEPVISHSQYDTYPPANINDEDIGPNSIIPPAPHEGVTQMTYSLCSLGVSKLAYSVSCGPIASKSEDMDCMMHEISSGIQDLEDQFPSRGSSYTGDEWNLHSRGSHLLVRLMTFKLWLYLHYPVYARFPAFRTTARETARVFTLALSTLFLLDEFGDDPSLVRFAWFFSMFVPWHPLDVSMSKICGQPSDDKARKSWPLVEKMYLRCQFLVAGGSTGAFWRPIRLLFDQTQVCLSLCHPSIVPRYLGPLGDVVQDEETYSANWGNSDDICTHNQVATTPTSHPADSAWSFDTPYFLI